MKHSLVSPPRAELKFVGSEFVIVDQLSLYTYDCLYYQGPGLICIFLDVSADKIFYTSPNNAG